ncbi:dTDP-4-dehydrorhamnose 3,5-epimerase [Shewanella vesiculosa]|jgi:dTDP-4-dehydrorhamnose 3,5-epimerase|uniref:dTDP-4-dehydrorhamnose 3,5-epimerase n=1 Tax=Shewanella vesiculosa TaxID=518738 RepID=UPI003CFD2926
MTPITKGVCCTQLKRIPHPKGDIYHAMKKSDGDFSSFGEAYFTTITAGEIKGWKKHKEMIMNLIVPVGGVIFYIYDEKTGVTENITLQPENYCRLTIQPGLWVAFKGLNNPLNLVLNIASLEHNPDEALNVPLETYLVE